LEHWRLKWKLPQYVYLSAGDNRLLLNLDDVTHVGVLRATLASRGHNKRLLLEEVVPSFDEIWIKSPKGRHSTEFVVPLVLRRSERWSSRGTSKKEKSLGDVAVSGKKKWSPVPLAERLRTPGSEWLFIKLYHLRMFEDDLIGGAVREFSEKVLTDGLADKWFFVRYSDPDAHLRLRFAGVPEILNSKLIIAVHHWASALIRDGLCLRFAIDTYDREVERYGGPAGTAVAEEFFAADSQAIATLIHLGGTSETFRKLDLAILTVEEIVAALCPSRDQRLQWYQSHVMSRHEASDEYRRIRTFMRKVVIERYFDSLPHKSQLGETLQKHRSAIQSLAQRLKTLDSEHNLSRPIPALCRSFVHLHCNRLLGTDFASEQAVLGLLWRFHRELKHHG
jgi:thiopeptide-type bacteriocin biosynthesis protein